MRLRVLLFLQLLLCVFTIVEAQSDVHSLWVGQSFTCDLSIASPIEHSNLDWNIADECLGYLSISPDGERCTVKIKKYFSGTLSVLSSWDYIPFPEDFPSYSVPMNLSWYFSCIENPVSISPTNMTLAMGTTGQVNYSHQFSNSYSTAANAGIHYTCTPSGVVSVSSTGKVTPLKAGTTKVYVHSNLANDENAPYCTVMVTSPTSVIVGDVNNDGSVNIADVTALIDLLLNGTSYYNAAADMNQDGSVNIADVTALIDYLLNGGGKKGDVNNDGQVNIADVTVLIDYLLNGSMPINKQNADMNSDGKINIADVTALIDYLLNDNVMNNELRVYLGIDEKNRFDIGELPSQFQDNRSLGRFLKIN